MKLIKLSVIAVSTLAMGCGASFEDCKMHKAPNMVTHHYDEVDPDAKTPAGIPVDTGGKPHDLAMIDTMVFEVKQCLESNFPTFHIPSEVRDKTYCKTTNFKQSFDAAFNFGCWQIKIDNNWVKSCDGTQQLLSAQSPTIPGQPCGGKPIIPTRECPCRYRVAITGKTLVVPPNARLLKDGLVRVITGCTNPWSHPLLSECARPSPLIGTMD